MMQPPALAQVVTPGVMARVNAKGEFILAQHGDSADAEISADQAKELVAAFWHDGGRSQQYGAGLDRGAAVHWTELVPCVRAYYVTSAYSRLQSDAPLIIRKALGPQWLVGLCYVDVEEVVVSISAFATDARIGHSQFRLEDPGVGNFGVMGVPVGAEIPVAPEDIAQLAAEQTNRRLAEVPLLVMRPFPKGAVTAVWQIDLDAPIAARGQVSGDERSLKKLFAGHLNGWSKPTLAAEIPNSNANRSDDEDQKFVWARPERLTHHAVTRRPGIARDLELITVGGR
jgi:hypothetical protein